MVKNYNFDIAHTTRYWRRVETYQVLGVEDGYGYRVCGVSFSSFS